MDTETIYVEFTNGVELELPKSARLDTALGKSACQWLDDYIAFSKLWSPQSYDLFHEAVGLWVLSTIAGRRVYVPVGKRHYPSLYIAFCSPTGVFAKTSAAEIGLDVLRASKLDFLLAPDDSTPEAFIRNLTRRVPDYYAKLPDERKEQMKQRIALAGQRGWYIEELGRVLNSMMKDNSPRAEYHRIILRFDDHAPTYSYETIGRGSEFIEYPYLSLLGCMTPSNLKKLGKQGSDLFDDGFWARFALIVPPIEMTNGGLKRFPKGDRRIPDYLIDPLRNWHNKLGVPEYDIKEVEDKNGKPTGQFEAVQVGGAISFDAKACEIDADALEAFNLYREALMTIKVSTDLAGNYIRFHMKALRIALLFASLENDNKIELRHWARAQEIAERWRGSLHNLAPRLEETQSNTPSAKRSAEDKILSVLKRKGELTLRELVNYTKLAREDLAQALAALETTKEVATRQTDKTKKYRLIV